MPKFVSGYQLYLIITSLVVISIYFYYRGDYSSFDTHPDKSYQCLIVSVVDGDSVKAFCDGLSYRQLSIRLMHIDAPELSQPLWGEKSRAALVDILSSNKYRVGINFYGKDYYQRYLGVLKLANKNVNKRMVEIGMATVYLHYNPPKQYRLARQIAKKQRLGIWQKSGLQQNPQRYRRLMQY